MSQGDTTPKLIVHSDPAIVSGTPVFVGTRVPAQALLDYLEGGETIEEFWTIFEASLREQAVAFLEEAGLLEENLPRKLRRELAEFAIRTLTRERIMTLAYFPARITNVMQLGFTSEHTSKPG